jgi:hypothetical protein
MANVAVSYPNYIKDSPLSDEVRKNFDDLIAYINARNDGTTSWDGIKLTLAVYADNAAALTGGLVAGQLYRTGADPDVVCIVH